MIKIGDKENSRGSPNSFNCLKAYYIRKLTSENGIAVNYFDYFGKTSGEGDGDTFHHLLVYHCLDVAAVTAAILDQHSSLREYFVRYLSLTNSQTVRFIVFLATCHDLGKFSASFQHRLNNNIFGKALIYDASKARHDVLGMDLWYSLRAQIVGAISSNSLDLKLIQPLVETTVGHHGNPVEIERPDQFKKYFQDRNVDDAKAFLLDFAKILQVDISSINVKKVQQRQVSWYLAGLITLADWIASNDQFFTYSDKKQSLDAYWKGAQGCAQKVCEKLNLLGHFDVKPFDSVEDVFGFLPSPSQAWAEKVDLSETPHLFIVEDTTGSGKTEAALTLAHRLLQDGAGTGLYFALPTMATSNAMYVRLTDYYEQLFDTSVSKPSLVLAHGSARNNPLFAQHVLRNTEKSLDGRADCLDWYVDSRKKALLSPIGVGTIDQALMSVLPLRHQSLRQFGLFRKILIVDEVHAADEYMLVLLRNLLAEHCRNGGSAILLTATLSLEQRSRLVNVWRKALKQKPTECPADFVQQFPAITHVHGKEADVDYVPIAQSPRSTKSFKVEFLSSRNACLNRVCLALDANDSLAWIVNSVHDALEIYRYLKAEIDDDQAEIILFHSRFTLGDRLKIERRLLDKVGKKSTRDHVDNRYRRRKTIVVATQVLQESLDLDFDVMISDICPIDDFIQRVGRYRRHTRDQNGALAPEEARTDPTVYLHAPMWTDQPAETWLSGDFLYTQYVYRSPGRLWLGMKKLLALGTVHLPEDSRGLIEAVYSEKALASIPLPLQEAEDELMAEHYAAMADGACKCIDFRYGYSTQSQKFWDDRLVDLSSRFCDRKTLPVVLVRKNEQTDVFELLTSSSNVIQMNTVKVPEAHYKDHLEPEDSETEKRIATQLNLPRYTRVWVQSADSALAYDSEMGFIVK